MDKVSIRIWLFLVLGLVILISGCISQEYRQEVSPDGSSIITTKVEMTKLIEMINKNFPEEAKNISKEFEELCSDIEKEDINCRIEGNAIIIQRKIPRENDYYEFRSIIGVPFNTYELRVKRIPTTLLNEIAKRAKKKAEIEVPTGERIDLKEKTQNKMLSNFWIKSKITNYYIVEMPGEIVNAYAGDYQAEISEDKKTAKFNLVTVFQNSSEIVVISNELNMAFIIGSIAFLGFLAAVMMYVREKR